jgi:hypothetical protein
MGCGGPLHKHARKEENSGDTRKKRLHNYSPKSG